MNIFHLLFIFLKHPDFLRRSPSFLPENPKKQGLKKVTFSTRPVDQNCSEWSPEIVSVPTALVIDWPFAELNCNVQ